MFACIDERRRVFADVEFVWQRLGDRRTFGSVSLSLLERPWPGGSTSDLLDRVMLHNDLAGNAFVLRARSPNGAYDILQVLRPDWVDLMLDRAAAEVVGFLYWPGGKWSGNPTPTVFTRDEVAHFYSAPDPDHPYRGMSWLTPVLREIEADKQTVRHQQAYFSNAATPNLLVTVEKRIESPEARRRFQQELDRKFSGVHNAYRTLILDDGADAKPIGANMEQASFTEVQASNENRIITASGVPPILIAAKLGLQAATYSNYGQASRSFATKMRPKWKQLCGALQHLLDVPGGPNGQPVRLWFDDRDNSAMREDARDLAGVQQAQASAVRTFVDAGYTPESAVLAVAGNDMTLLEHSGLPSVQLQQGTMTQQPVSDDEGNDDDA
ncbi:MAG: phage portal protein [Gemmatimonadota bacterium]|nr:MAG: phage portal protein [Gemmatimonadota bacterium]